MQLRNKTPKRRVKAKLPAWLKVHGAAANESDGLRGSFTADLSLWFMLACSFAAVCGVVSHRDVIHSHAVIILWVILHHMTRAATAWRGTGYLHTLFTPSAALLPIRTLDDAPCRRGAFLPHTLRFEPRVSRTSALFVARIGKRPHPEAE